jgi:hypothetical protein
MCIPVSAEYYRYTDKDGNIYFTDEKAKIPKSQREDIVTYESEGEDSDLYYDPDVEYVEDETGFTEEEYYDEDMEAAPEDMEYDVIPAEEDIYLDEYGTEEEEFSEEEELTEEEYFIEEEVAVEDETVMEDIESAGEESYLEEVDETVEEELLEYSEETDETVLEGEDLAEEEGLTGEEELTGESMKTPATDSGWRRLAQQKQQEIDARKKELIQRKQAIEAEKEELGPPPPDDASYEEKNAYFEKTKELNDSIEQYQNDYKAIEKDVETFNAELSKQMR